MQTADVMRVIAGTAKGRQLRAVRGLATRPTADKVKGALFSILGSRVDIAGAQVLDLFAGSGALGIEALSRGAAHATFVEQSAAAVRVLRDNLRACGFVTRGRVLQMPVARALVVLGREPAAFDGVVLDPPYTEGLVRATLEQLDARALVRPDGWVMLEHHLQEPPPAVCGALHLTQRRQYGKTSLALLRVHAPMPRPPSEGSIITRAVYAGSFDPITNGHLDVVRRAVEVFDEVIIAIAGNTSDPNKDRALFTAEERVTMVREALSNITERASTTTFTGLLVDYCERVSARVIIRGLRAVSDFEYEFQMAMMNRHLKPAIETVFMAAGAGHFYTSSRLVKEVVALGGDVRGLVPDGVYQRLLKKLRAQP